MCIDTDKLLRVVWVVISGIQRDVCTYRLGVDQSPVGCFYPHLKSTHILFLGNAKLVIFSFMRQGILCIGDFRFIKSS